MFSLNPHIWQVKGVKGVEDPIGWIDSMRDLSLLPAGGEHGRDG